MNAPEFYTAFARLYDAVARAPGVGRVRDEFAAALAPDEGDTVLDVGCGTGANHRPLREEIGPEGTYVGVDFSPGVLRIARERESGPGTHFCRGDATRPPIRPATAPPGATAPPTTTDPPAAPTAADQPTAPTAADPPAAPTATTDSVETGETSRSVDAVCASFLVGMLADPPAAVQTWARLVGPGGRLGLLNLSRTSRSVWQPLNLPFRLLVRVGSPPSGLDGADRFESPVQRLERRVEAAHTELERVCAEETLHRDHRALGFARITAGTVLPESEWSPVE